MSSAGTAVGLNPVGCTQRGCGVSDMVRATLQSLKRTHCSPLRSLPNSWMDTLSENFNKHPQNKKTQFL